MAWSTESMTMLSVTSSSRQARVQAGAVQGLGHHGHQVLLLKLTGREVHRHGQALPAPARATAWSGGRPAPAPTGADGHDLAGVLGQGDELAGG